MNVSVFFIPVLLQLAGVVVVIAEIIIPSGGILAILSLGIFGYSLYLVFQHVSSSAGFLFLGMDAILIPVTILLGLKLLAKSPATLQTKLSSKNGVTVQSSELEFYIGLEGTAMTDLRPSGIALINGKRVDVVTRGEYLEKNSPITVFTVTGNQIIVQKKENA
ncbi:MAG: serine protease [Proteobacteria bacterium]|nr:serine protease [Pseudomonadota bacterium]